MRAPRDDVAQSPGAVQGRRPGSLSVDELTVELAWPTKKLFPNGARGHWGALARVRKRYRDDALCLALLALGGRMFTVGGELVRVDLEFAPPIARRNGTRNASRPDDDNAVAAIKAGLDGIADAVGTNDRLFQLGAPRWASPVPGGAVRVRLTRTQ